MNERIEDIISKDNNLDDTIYKILNEAYYEFRQMHGEKHSLHIKEILESITDKVRSKPTYYFGPVASAHPEMGIVYSASQELSAVLKHELWHMYNNVANDREKSLQHIPKRYMDQLKQNGYLEQQYIQTIEEYKEKYKNNPERLEHFLISFEDFLNNRFDFGDSTFEMWTEWFNSQTHLRDTTDNFWDWGDGYFTKSHSTGSFYDAFINIASIISCIIPKDKLLEMYLYTSDYPTDYSYPEMLDEFDSKYANSLDQDEKEKYRYPYLKILMNIKDVSENAKRNPSVSREALQSCMKTCFDAYSQKLDHMQDIDFEQAKKLYAEIKYMQENMVWNTDISKLQGLDYIQALNRVQDKFKAILQNLGLDNPEVQKMFESIDYASKNPFHLIENGKEIAEKISTIPKEDKDNYASIGSYRTKVGKSGIKGNLYSSLFILLNDKKFNLLFTNFQDSTFLGNDGNVLLEIYSQIEGVKTDDDVIDVYNSIYELYARKIEHNLRTDKNIDNLFDRYSREIVELQKNGLFRDGKYPPKLEQIISIYSEKAQVYAQKIDSCTELDIQYRIKQGMPADVARDSSKRFSNMYIKKLQERQDRITSQRENQALEYMEFDQRGEIINLGVIKENAYLIQTSQIGKATINVPTLEKKQAEEVMKSAIARETVEKDNAVK